MQKTICITPGLIASSAETHNSIAGAQHMATGFSMPWARPFEIELLNDRTGKVGPDSHDVVVVVSSFLKIPMGTKNELLSVLCARDIQYLPAVECPVAEFHEM